MILILSKKNNESPTNKVIEWLNYKNANYKRLNAEDMFDNFDYSDSEVKFDSLDFSKINVCWFRRSYDESYISDKLENADMDNSNYLELTKYLEREVNRVNRLFFRSLNHCKWLSHPSELQNDKLYVLKIAQKIGFKIPKTIITTKKRILVKFIKEEVQVISKCIGEATFFWDKEKIYSTKTILIKEEHLNEVKETFFPTLFQTHIHKKYELRIFYLDEKIYSMAIFSQSDETTKIDFRNYNYSKPNRTVPYKVPNELQMKIVNLMKELNLTTGSIDIIVDDKGNYIFLEVNPVGQFGMTSYPCNYYIEEKIADYLIMKDNE